MRLLKYLVAFMLFCSPALADSQGSATGGTRGTQSTLTGCQFQSAPATLSSGQQTGIACDNKGNITVVGSSSGTPMPVTPSARTAVSTSALASNQVVSAAAANLFSFTVQADSTLSGAAWWVMIFNATSLPANGAVTPVKCYALPSGSTGVSAAFPSPVSFSTGIVIGVSTTGCFSLTASVHAFISGDI